MNANSTKREIWIDNCKVIAIFLVVFGHLIEQLPYIHSQFPTLLIVTTIHMPIFFFCSGYLFKPIKIKTALKKYFNRLIIPYIFFNLICLILLILLKKPKHLLQYIGKKFLGMILVVNSPKSISLINDPTWFLISLFCIIMIFLIMKKYLKSDKKILISVLILVISAYLLQIFNINTAFSIPATCVGLLFFYMGYIFKKNNLKQLFKNTKFNLISLIISFIIWICLYLTGNSIIFRLGLCNGNPILAYITSIAGLLFIISLTQLLEFKNKLIIIISTYTLVIMSLDKILRKIFTIGIAYLNITQVNLIEIIILGILILLIASGIGIILNKTIPQVIGKKPILN